MILIQDWICSPPLPPCVGVVVSNHARHVIVTINTGFKAVIISDHCLLFVAVLKLFSSYEIKVRILLNGINKNLLNDVIHTHQTVLNCVNWNECISVVVVHSFNFKLLLPKLGIPGAAQSILSHWWFYFLIEVVLSPSRAAFLHIKFYARNRSGCMIGLFYLSKGLRFWFSLVTWILSVCV